MARTRPSVRKIHTFCTWFLSYLGIRKIWWLESKGTTLRTPYRKFLPTNERTQSGRDKQIKRIHIICIYCSCISTFVLNKHLHYRECKLRQRKPIVVNASSTFNSHHEIIASARGDHAYLHDIRQRWVDEFIAVRTGADCLTWASWPPLFDHRVHLCCHDNHGSC